MNKLQKIAKSILDLSDDYRDQIFSSAIEIIEHSKHCLGIDLYLRDAERIMYIYQSYKDKVLEYLKWG